MSNDLMALQELGAALRPAGGPPADLRRRVLTSARTHRTFGALLGWKLALAGVTAAAVAAVAAFVPGLSPGQTVQQAGNAPPAAQPKDAAQVLELAAQHAALAGRTPKPRADQFLYQDVVSISPGGKSLVRARVWRSVDGKRDGLRRVAGRPDEVLPGCRSGRTTPDPQKNVCMPAPAIDPALPTDPKLVDDYLSRARDDEEALAEVSRLVQIGSPEVVAATFRAAERIRGVRVVEGVTDVAGRRGVGLTRHAKGKTGGVLIFDSAHGYAYLGYSLERDGVVERGRASFQVTITDRAGEQP